MRKNSKAGDGRGMETIGVDLGDKMSRYAILNEEGRVVEEGSFRNSAESIAKHFGKQGRVRVALEVGTQSAWISREFTKLGHEVIVANARELKWITASDTKNDRNDAVKLARLARADRNLLAPVEHRGAEQQAELGVIRAREALVKSRTQLVNTEFGKGVRPAVAVVDHDQLWGAGAGAVAAESASGAGRVAGADRRVGRQD